MRETRATTDGPQREITCTHDILAILKETGAYLSGHFKLSSGLHSPVYVEKFRLLERPELAEKVLSALAERFRGDGVEVVVGPTTGGIIVAYEVARHLRARAIFAEREGGRRVLRRGFTIAPGEKVLVVEDVVTTGSSVREVLDIVERSGGQTVGVGMIVDRSGGRVDFGVRTERLVRVEFGTYVPEECPLCKENVTLTDPGSRRLEPTPGNRCRSSTPPARQSIGGDNT
ncbi:MAG: orotate phosphoribosyltransferase [Firmicutes bacterium]|jgi:orotate phosphoribosyltransferase|nr:orotate phosphoribosyltransferase [Bacillota bacterium]MDH7495041.1 orotate phosphoribosyltransferase [Bacillota bacterium]